MNITIEERLRWAATIGASHPHFSGVADACLAAATELETMRKKVQYLQSALDNEKSMGAHYEGEIETLRAQLARYTRRSESGESLGDLYDIADQLAEKDAALNFLRGPFKDVIAKVQK
jgi:hypothetical protein